MTIEFRSRGMLRCNYGGEQERTGDEGEDDQQAHEHKEILQTGEGCKEACGNA